MEVKTQGIETISNQAPVKWGRLNGYPIARSTLQVIGSGSARHLISDEKDDDIAYT